MSGLLRCWMAMTVRNSIIGGVMILRRILKSMRDKRNAYIEEQCNHIRGIVSRRGFVVTSSLRLSRRTLLECGKRMKDEIQLMIYSTRFMEYAIFVRKDKVEGLLSDPWQ